MQKLQFWQKTCQTSSSFHVEHKVYQIIILQWYFIAPQFYMVFKDLTICTRVPILDIQLSIMYIMQMTSFFLYIWQFLVLGTACDVGVCHFSCIGMKYVIRQLCSCCCLEELHVDGFYSFVVCIHYFMLILVLFLFVVLSSSLLSPEQRSNATVEWEGVQHRTPRPSGNPQNCRSVGHHRSFLLGHRLSYVWDRRLCGVIKLPVKLPSDPNQAKTVDLHLHKLYRNKILAIPPATHRLNILVLHSLAVDLVVRPSSRFMPYSNFIFVLILWHFSYDVH